MYRPLVSCVHRDNYGGCRVHKYPWLLRWLGRPACVFNNPMPPRDGERTCAEQYSGHVPRAPGKPPPPPSPPDPPRRKA